MTLTTKAAKVYKQRDVPLFLSGGVSMRKLCAGLTVATLVLALGASAHAATQTLSGQLIDQTCYKLDKSNTGVDHKMPDGPTPACATTCAKMGQPVALLTADGKVYTVTGDLAANNNAKLVPHMSHKVELTGDVTEKGGTMTISATSLKMISK